MNKTKIEWCDYTINPVKGLCPMACSYCYARRMYKRFKRNPEIRFDWSVANDLSKITKPSRIFWGSTMELFGDWVKPEWMRLVFEAVKRHPEHQHIFLTKQPLNLAKWSPFPDNCWVGVSTTGFDCRSGFEDIFTTFEAKVKFASIEPLLNYTPLDMRWINWLIIGQQTPPSPKTSPRIEWVKEIVQAADKAGVPVFLKNNLNSCSIADYPELLNSKTGNLRQEFPNWRVSK